MDSGKLNRILTDLVLEESKLNINGQLDEIKNDFSQNNPDSFASASEKIEKIYTIIENESVVYTFSPSENVFLKNIEGETFFGPTLTAKLKSIFRSPAYEIIPKLDDFRNQRVEFMSRVQRLIDGFAGLKITEYRPEAYEVGLTIPENHSNATEVIEILIQFERLVSGIVEGTNGKYQPVKIKRLSNGSACFFSPVDIDSAFKFTAFIADILTIWTCIEALNKRKKNNDNDTSLSEEGKLEMNLAIENEAKRIKEKILEELPKKIISELEGGRGYEIRNKISLGIHAVFKWIQLGVELDITPVRVEITTPEGEENKENEVNSEIKKSNQQLIHLYTLPLEQRTLPFELTEPKLEKEDKPIIKKTNQDESSKKT